MILGTAGHIDHGKTALVRALTGVDTDRLPEERQRGISIELGFAELPLADGLRFGVVDVPGHEAFVRAMVAGAAGMDVVLLVVAADEGVMPQTREHLAIVELLGVPELVVAITKCDAVDEEWLELVEAEVSELLARTPYAGARTLRTSAVQGTGLEALAGALAAAAERVRARPRDDLARLPLDRVFTIQGTGTVVTGTLWSGTLAAGDRVRVLPQGVEARVRSVQVHEREVERAYPGDRTAVALAGEGASRDVIERGSTLITAPDWPATWMLTTRVSLLPDTGWSLAHNQRVRVHHATAEVLARCALLEDAPLAAGEHGWVQLRLEAPLAARARDRLVLRAYSPMTTIGGGVVAEPAPPKRRRLDAAERAALARVVDGGPEEALAAHVELSGWSGALEVALPLQLGLPPSDVASALERLGDALLRGGPRLFSAAVRDEAARRVLAALDRAHAEDPLRTSVPLAAVRAALPRWAAPELADAVLARLAAEGRIELADGGVRRAGHRAELTPEQEEASRRLEALLAEGDLAAPEVAELPAELAERADLWPLLKRLEALGRVRQVAPGLFLDAGALERAAERIAAMLGGRTGLGPADFKEALPVTRKRLLPLLAYFDGLGATVRRGDGRDVPGR